MDRALSEAGYIYDGVRSGEGHAEAGRESSELFHQDRVRIVIVGADGRVVKDNLSELLPGTTVSDLDGHGGTVFDLTTNRPVGRVYVDVNHEFLSSESHGFLSALLYIILIGGMLTISVAVLLAAWLSKQITAPVTALTEATQTIAQGDTTRLPVTSSLESDHASGTGQAQALAVSITDDGVGIDAADLPHIFDRFYRTDQSRGRGIGGAGLGTGDHQGYSRSARRYDCGGE